MAANSQANVARMGGGARGGRFAFGPSARGPFARGGERKAERVEGSASAMTRGEVCGVHHIQSLRHAVEALSCAPTLMWFVLPHRVLSSTFSLGVPPVCTPSARSEEHTEATVTRVGVSKPRVDARRHLNRQLKGTTSSTDGTCDRRPRGLGI